MDPRTRCSRPCLSAVGKAEGRSTHPSAPGFALPVLRTRCARPPPSASSHRQVQNYHSSTIPMVRRLERWRQKGRAGRPAGPPVGAPRLLFPEPYSAIYGVRDSPRSANAENRMSCFSVLAPRNARDSGGKSFVSPCSLITFRRSRCPPASLAEAAHIRHIRSWTTHA